MRLAAHQVWGVAPRCAELHARMGDRLRARELQDGPPEAAWWCDSRPCEVQMPEEMWEHAGSARWPALRLLARWPVSARGPPRGTSSSV